MTKIKDPSLPVPPKDLGLRGAAILKWQVQQLMEINKELKAAPSAISEPQLASIEMRQDEVYDSTNDPLAWVTEDVYQVYMVGRIYGVRGRRQMSDLRGTQEKTYFNADRTAEWAANPFSYTHPDPDYQRQLEILNKMWWVFTLDREFAEEVYSGFESSPERAIIDPKDYKGRDMKGRPLGKKSKASNDPLREYARWVLQTNPKTMWLNDDAGHYIENGFITKGFPNPYGAGVQIDEPKPRAAGHMDASEYVGGVIS